MSNYTLIQLAQGLPNLLDERHDNLVLSKAGRYYEAALTQKRAAIDALPPALTGGTPLAAELAEADARHDGYGAAVYFAVEAVLRLPDAPADVKEAAERVRAAFVPALADLQDSYLAEAHRAKERRPLLASMKADLERFPVLGGETLLDVCTKLLDAGDRLNALLDQRGDAPQADRSEAAALRARAVGILNRFRDELRAEIESDPSLPRDLEHRVFGYLDTIAA